jgi:hypothetical protein
VFSKIKAANNIKNIMKLSIIRLKDLKKIPARTGESLKRLPDHSHFVFDKMFLV